MVVNVVLSLLALAGVALLFIKPLHNAALFVLSGTVMAYFYYAYPGTVPGVQFLAFLFWGISAWLMVSRFLSSRRGRAA